MLGFDKDVPAQAVGQLGQLMQSRAGEPSPRFHFGELLSWIGQNAKAKQEYRQASALDPKGLIGRFARSVLKASGLIPRSREGDGPPSANLGGHEHYLLARGP